MWTWIGIAVAVIVLGGVAAMLFITVPIAKKVYFHTLVRDNPEKWQRVCSDTTNEEQVQMWESGKSWAEENRSHMHEVEIENDGLRLFGEYYDFGGDSCVVIIPGRCECLIYSYYFAEPYKESGCNVLVIDTRAHGKSDGKYNTIGSKESGDVLKWLSFVEEKYDIHSFFIHSICVGSSTAMIAMTKDSSGRIKGLVTEGCFTSFRECYKTHMIYDNRPLFPVLDLVMLYIRRYTGAKLSSQAPIRLVKKLHQPVLFLFGKQDVFSRPPKSQKLFEASCSEKKQIMWFDKGAHSHLRINNTEKYDRAICDFVSEVKTAESR